jgi:hypothetical protein
MEPQVKVRRARREDFERVRSLLGATAPALRAERKRFRHLVSTLREDLYIAERAGDATLVGLAVIVYPRGLGVPTAVVRQLRGAPEAAAPLLDRARARAAARGCVRLELQLDPGEVSATPALVAALTRDGWTAGPRTLVRTVPG